MKIPFILVGQIQVGRTVYRCKYAAAGGCEDSHPEVSHHSHNNDYVKLFFFLYNVINVRAARGIQGIGNLLVVE
jgi:hypothetical protein